MSLVDHRWHSTIRWLTSSGHFFNMLKKGPLGDGAVLVDSIAMTVLNASTVMSLLNISSVSVHCCGLFGTCDMPYQMLSSAGGGILSEILNTAVRM